MSYRSFYKLAFMPKPISKAATPLAPRKSPTQARSVATVEAILQAAAHILETEGLSACSTNAVARKAGVSIGSLYQYFPSKDAISRALILEQTTALVEDAEKIDLEQGGRKALEDLIDVAITHQLKRPALAKILDAEELRLPVAEDLKRQSTRLHKTVHDILSQADMPEGASDTEVMADLMGIIKGMVDAAGTRAGSESPASAANLRKRVRRAVFGYLDAGE
ncbi:TetR/AcrR family transcriptional regulator [Undibacterium sp. CY18W]|uniref:TetR/AcrR family transcriptional regulator n=1 Tax=Undibacterium hunanense TaxID=2762292 RepID=A0ABR6ZM16_9BURK|nr:TetR/AcrR family transcriptional regulator [Undibacterium hunanense]MBC3916939.1 TetR/AcrR family transcriptional regulator [Undibacterium hunanense]